MADYSYTELMKMQNDAIRRVEDMQKRARRSAGLGEENNKNVVPVSQTSTQPIPKEPPRRVPMPNDYLENLKKFASDSLGGENDTNPKSETPLPLQNIPNNNSNGLSDSLKNILNGINIDSDKALLLSLIMLLSEENADEMLVLALIYMMT